MRYYGVPMNGNSIGAFRTVFYLPAPQEWQSRCTSVLACGFSAVASFNPYWDVNGRTFADHDGYRIVLQNAAWTAA